MKLRIANRVDGLNAIAWADCAISLEEPGSKLLPAGGRHGVFCFEDSVDLEPTSPKRSDIQAILAHVEACGTTLRSRLLVHCFAGLSRSPAVAWGTLVHLGLSPEAALTRVLRVRPESWPNTLVLRHFDEVLGLGGRLFEMGCLLDRSKARRPALWHR